eukprot:g73007.t1
MEYSLRNGRSPSTSSQCQETGGSPRNRQCQGLGKRNLGEDHRSPGTSFTSREFRTHDSQRPHKTRNRIGSEQRCKQTVVCFKQLEFGSRAIFQEPFPSTPRRFHTHDPPSAPRKNRSANYQRRQRTVVCFKQLDFGSRHMFQESLLSPQPPLIANALLHGEYADEFSNITIPDLSLEEASLGSQSDEELIAA